MAEHRYLIETPGGWVVPWRTDAIGDQAVLRSWNEHLLAQAGRSDEGLRHTRTQKGLSVRHDPACGTCMEVRA